MQAELGGGFTVERAALERVQLHIRIFLVAVLALDMEEMKQQTRAVVGGDKGAAPLLAHQHVLRDQFVDCLADGADGDAEFVLELRLGGNRLARLPRTLRQAAREGAGDVAVDRTARCGEGGKGRPCRMRRRAGLR